MPTFDELISPKQPASIQPGQQTYTADELLGPPPPPPEPGYLETIATGVTRGAAGIASGVGSALEWAGDVGGVQGLRDAGKSTQQFAERVIEGPGRLDGQTFQGTFMENPSLKRGVEIVAEAAPSLVAAMTGGGAVAAGLRGLGLAARTAQTAGTVAAASGLGVVEGAPQYTEAREKGQSVGRASASGVAATVGTAALEALGLGKLFGQVGKGAVKGGLAGTVTEGLQEGAQQVWQNLVAKLGYDNSRSLADGLAESIIGGAGAGGITGAVVGRLESKQSQQADRAGEQALRNIIKDADITVSDGVATVINPSGTRLVAPLNMIADALGNGVSIDELVAAQETVAAGLEAQQEAEKPKSKFTRLPDTDTTIGFDISGKEYRYTPPEGTTVAQMNEQLAGLKNDGARVNYLKKNATLVPAAAQPEVAPLDQQTKDTSVNGKPPAALFSFAGQNAKNAPAITAARNMKENGSSPDEIWRKTGWWEITPGQWSFEIDDSLSSVTAEDGKLGDVLKHPQLYNNYPELRNIDIEFKPIGDNLRGRHYRGGTGKIVINSELTPEQQRATLHHEVQHAIQRIEGFAPGASLSAAADKKADYWRKTGEVEARLVSYRRNMTPAQRARISPQQALGMMLRQEGLMTEGQSVGDVLTSIARGETPTAVGMKTGSVVTELKNFLGRGYDNLVRRGKLDVVQSVDELPEEIRAALGSAQVLPAAAYHGSPHRFGRFSTSNIGTGEGAQAYGWGIYFASSKEVAEWYREKLARYDADTIAQAKQYMIDTGLGINPDEDYAYADENDYVTAAIYMGFKPSPKGQLYKVELAPQEDEYLLWDKPLSEQSEKVRTALLSAAKDNSVIADIFKRRNNTTGYNIYDDIQYTNGDSQKAASEYLHSLGIRGIKYLDGSSRSKGDGDYNYVIFDENDVSITETLYSQNGAVAGAYSPSQGKVWLIGDNIKPGDAQYVMLHEASHALLMEDKLFVKQREKILSDFASMREKDASIAAAYDKVPAGTAEGYTDIEALAYWLQEKKNHKRPLFQRIVAAIRAALYRLGLTAGKLKPADIAQLFTQGAQAWSQQEAVKDELTQPDVMFSMADTALQNGRKKLGTAMGALSNPRSKLHDLYVQYAPQWLSVTPLQTLVQTFGKRIPQLKDFARNLNRVVSIKDEIANSSAVFHEQATEAAGDRLDDFNRAAATASYNRITPWDTIYDQQWVPKEGTKAERLKAAEKAWNQSGMKRSIGKTFQEAYTEARNTYNVLTPKAKEAYTKIVEHIASIRSRERTNLLAFIEAATEGKPELRAQWMSRFNATFKDLHGAYWPLARFGNFRLEYVDSEGRRTVEYLDSIAERRARIAEVLQQGVDEATIVEDYKDVRPGGSVGLPQELMAQLSNAVTERYMQGIDQNDATQVAEAQERAQGAIDDMQQIWLRWLPDTAALKNSLRRKNIKGFDTDMLRSYLDYMQRHASSIAWTEQGRKLDDNIKSLSDDIKEKTKANARADVTMDRHLVNDLRNRIQALRTARVGRTASFLGKMGTAWYMTSPSIALVQMSQLGTLTLPKLAVKFKSLPKASKALAAGVKASFSRDYTREAMFGDSEVTTVYENLHMTVNEQNRNEAQAQGKSLGDPLYTKAELQTQIDRLSKEQRQLLALREAMARNLLDISAAHEAYELARGEDPESLLNWAMKKAMLPMSLSELASRKATVIATMEMSEAQGKKFFDMMNDVGEVIDDTLFSYAKENKGSALQGGFSRVLLQFQHYRIMTAIRLGMLLNNSLRGETKDVKLASFKEFTGIMGMSGVLAGALGVPFANIIFQLLDLFAPDDEPRDSKLEFTNWLREQLGETVGNVATRGLPSLAGIDLSRRIGLADIYGFQNEPPTGLHGRDLAAWWAASQLGPAFSVGSGFVQGYDEIVNKGNYLRGLTVAAPKPLRDVLKAYQSGTDGLKNAQGKRLLASDDIGIDEVLLMALGFNPDEVSKAQSAERSLGKLSTLVSERRGKLIRNAARAILEGESGGEAMQAVLKFNRSMPRFAIKGGDIRPAVRKIIVGEFGTTGLREQAVANQWEVPVFRGR